MAREKKKMTEKQELEFEAICKPVIEWLNKNGTPDCMVLIDLTSAGLLEGKFGFYNDDYLA